MYEVELKVRADHGTIRSALSTAGASLGTPVAQADTYYDAPHRSFAESGEALRIRRAAPLERTPEAPVADVVQDALNDAAATLTYKGPLIDDHTKTREELETGLESGESAEAILAALSFDATATVSKIRTSATLEGYTVTLDRVAGLGEFVEVERTVPEAEVDAAREGAREILSELGCDPGDGIRTSYLELLLES